MNVAVYPCCMGLGRALALQSPEYQVRGYCLVSRIRHAALWLLILQSGSMPLLPGTATSADHWNTQACLPGTAREKQSCSSTERWSTRPLPVACRSATRPKSTCPSPSVCRHSGPCSSSSGRLPCVISDPAHPQSWLSQALRSWQSNIAGKPWRPCMLSKQDGHGADGCCRQQQRQQQQQQQQQMVRGKMSLQEGAYVGNGKLLCRNACAHRLTAALYLVHNTRLSAAMQDLCMAKTSTPAYTDCLTGPAWLEQQLNGDRDVAVAAGIAKGVHKLEQCAGQQLPAGCILAVGGRQQLTCWL